MAKMSSVALFSLLFLGIGTVNAQTPSPSQNAGSMNSMHNAPMSSSPMDAAGSTAGFKAANDKMMKDMSMEPTGDADKDFVAGMIPHHQGAIDMAQVELKYGKDAHLKKLAHDIIAAQKKEIAFMQGWQRKHGVEPMKR